MQLKRLTLENFRACERLDLELGSRLTMLLGNNGSGKTSVLDGIAIGLGAVLTHLPSVSGLTFSRQGDIRQQHNALAPYTRIGMNLYRDGHDSVAMHGDKLHTVAAGHPLTLVSLGAPRRMLIRAREGRRETLAVDLAPGSVLSMSHASQSTHEHGIPKTRRAQGPRISVVFRVRPA